MPSRTTAKTEYFSCSKAKSTVAFKVIQYFLQDEDTAVGRRCDCDCKEACGVATDAGTHWEECVHPMNRQEVTSSSSVESRGQ